MIKKHHGEEKFYGLTTMGEKGQAVIPAEARSAMDLKKGEKLLVMGMGKEFLVLAKISDLKKFASDLSDKLNALREIIKKSG
jgi:AbrB family looped-hinge helix DNA binding protein